MDIFNIEAPTGANILVKLSADQYGTKMKETQEQVAKDMRVMFPHAKDILVTFAEIEHIVVTPPQ